MNAWSPITASTRHTNVIVGFDGNGESCDALAFGKLIAGATAAELSVAAVYPGRNGASTEPRRDFFSRVFARAAYEVGETSFTRREMIDSPARGLHGLADAEGASLIVVGSTHRGRFGEVLPGSVGNQLLSGTPCPVAVAPRGFVDDPRLATDRRRIRRWRRVRACVALRLLVWRRCWKPSSG